MSQSAGISNTTYTKGSEAPICNDKKQRNTYSSYVMSPLHPVIHAVSKLLCFLLTESAKLKADRSLGENTPPAANGASAATSCTGFCTPAATAAAVASSRQRRKASSSSSDGHFFIRLSAGSDGHLSLSALLLSWLLLRPRRRPQSTRLLETGDAAKQSTEGGKKGLFGDRKRKETRRGKEGGKVAGCNGVRRGKQIAVSSGTAFARYLRVCHSAAPSAVMSPYGGSAVRRSVLPCWLRIGEKKRREPLPSPCARLPVLRAGGTERARD